MKSNLSAEKIEVLTKLVNHGMLKLYIDVAYSIRTPNVEQKNKIVIRYLKSAMNRKCYKIVKSSVRELIHYAKKPKANMEDKLREVESVIFLTKATENKYSDLNSFMTVLTDIEKWTPIKVDIYNPSKCDSDSTYLEPGFLVNSFDTNGFFRNYISIIVPTSFREIVFCIAFDNDWICKETTIFNNGRHSELYLGSK